VGAVAGGGGVDAVVAAGLGQVQGLCSAGLLGHDVAAAVDCAAVLLPLLPLLQMMLLLRLLQLLFRGGCLLLGVQSRVPAAGSGTPAQHRIRGEALWPAGETAPTCCS
jgi:hypothetical protein